jgi:hypothetical protein
MSLSPPAVIVVVSLSPAMRGTVPARFWKYREGTNALERPRLPGRRLAAPTHDPVYFSSLLRCSSEVNFCFIGSSDSSSHTTVFLHRDSLLNPSTPDSCYHKECKIETRSLTTNNHRMPRDVVPTTSPRAPMDCYELRGLGTIMVRSSLGCP